MATNLLKKGDNLELDGGVLNIFGNKGFIDGKSWCMNLFAGCFIQVSPAPASSEIESVINMDIDNGCLENIHHVQVLPNSALRLYLEGRLTRKDIEKAEVTDDSVTFKSVKFHTTEGEKIYDVVVVAESEHVHATIDKNGKVV